MSLHLSFEMQISEFYFFTQNLLATYEIKLVGYHSKSLILFMILKFQQHLKANFSVEGRKLLLAFSGGLDSSVLLDLCLNVGLKPSLAHCNFQLRGLESDQDAEWVKVLAEKKQLNYHIQNFDTQRYIEEHKTSVQLAARDLRYGWFENLVKDFGYDFVLVAHHADDALETFMINAMRGTGLRGLLGIPQRRGKFLRPLLPFTRGEIEKYARKNRLDWREDLTNTKTDYLRNSLRHEIIPLWKSKASNFDLQFQSTLHHLGQAQAALDHVAQNFKSQNFITKAGEIKISVEALKGLSPLDYYLHSLFSPYGFQNVSDLSQLLEAQSGKQLFSNTHRLIKDRNHFLLTTIQNPSTEFYLIDSDISAIQTPIRLSFINEKSFVRGNSNHLLLDKSKLKFPLTLRKWKQSDYFYPNGLKGSKKLSKYFKDEKYSLLEKEAQWILCSGEDIVWLIGKRADQRFLADIKTKEKWLIRYND
jgi:tRNA(Ile)-lysidine synthase